MITHLFIDQTDRSTSFGDFCLGQDTGLVVLSSGLNTKYTNNTIYRVTQEMATMFRYPVFPHLQGELTNNVNSGLFVADFEFDVQICYTLNDMMCKLILNYYD